MLANTPHTVRKARNHTNRRSLNVVTSPTQPPNHPSTPPHPSLPTPKSKHGGLLAVSYRLRHLLLPEILAYHLAPATRVHSHFTRIPVSQAWRPGCEAIAPSAHAQRGQVLIAPIARQTPFRWVSLKLIPDRSKETHFLLSILSYILPSSFHLLPLSHSERQRDREIEG